MSRLRPSRPISPTAYYTGQVWVRNGLSAPCLETRFGRALFAAVEPAVRVLSPYAEGATLEGYLLQRHLGIDAVLTRAIESEGVLQVLEVAAGLSPRGLRFGQRYAERGLTYVEADLPAMAEGKRRCLCRDGLSIPRHRVVDLDLMAATGPQTLEAVAAAELDPGQPVAILVEGLLTYFPRAAVEGVLSRLVRLLRRFPRGLFVANLELSGEAGRYLPTWMLVRVLGWLTAGTLHLHYEDEGQVRSALVAAGFDEVSVHRPEDLIEPVDQPQIVRIVETWAR